MSEARLSRQRRHNRTPHPGLLDAGYRPIPAWKSILRLVLDPYRHPWESASANHYRRQWWRLALFFGALTLLSAMTCGCAFLNQRGRARNPPANTAPSSANKSTTSPPPALPPPARPQTQLAVSGTRGAPEVDQAVHLVPSNHAGTCQTLRAEIAFDAEHLPPTDVLHFLAILPPSPSEVSLAVTVHPPLKDASFRVLKSGPAADAVGLKDSFRPISEHLTIRPNSSVPMRIEVRKPDAAAWGDICTPKCVVGVEAQGPFGAVFPGAELHSFLSEKAAELHTIERALETHVTTRRTSAPKANDHDPHPGCVAPELDTLADRIATAMAYLRDLEEGLLQSPPHLPANAGLTQLADVMQVLKTPLTVTPGLESGRSFPWPPTDPTPALIFWTELAMQVQAYAEANPTSNPGELLQWLVLATSPSQQHYRRLRTQLPPLRDLDDAYGRLRFCQTLAQASNGTASVILPGTDLHVNIPRTSVYNPVNCLIGRDSDAPVPDTAAAKTSVGTWLRDRPETREADDSRLCAEPCIEYDGSLLGLVDGGTLSMHEWASRLEQLNIKFSYRHPTNPRQKRISAAIAREFCRGFESGLAIVRSPEDYRRWICGSGDDCNGQKLVRARSVLDWLPDEAPCGPPARLRETARKTYWDRLGAQRSSPKLLAENIRTLFHLNDGHLADLGDRTRLDFPPAFGLGRAYVSRLESQCSLTEGCRELRALAEESHRWSGEFSTDLCRDAEAPTSPRLLQFEHVQQREVVSLVCRAQQQVSVPIAIAGRAGPVLMIASRYKFHINGVPAREGRSLEDRFSGFFFKLGTRTDVRAIIITPSTVHQEFRFVNESALE